jgi:dynein heavy chain
MVQLKSFGAPPPSAAIVMEGLCYIFNEDQNVKVVDKEKDFWGYAKKHILNDKLIKRIRDFKEE